MEVEPSIKLVNEIANVLYDKKWLKTAHNFGVYYVWRGIKEDGDLRYDLTRINSEMLGQEFPKTQGHDHVLTTPELITVTKGEAIFLYQKCQNKKVIDVYGVSAKKGETVIAPGDYAHFTINPGAENLEFTNWINKKNLNAYDFVAKMGGACYFYTKSGWIKNENYQEIPALRFEKPLQSAPTDLTFLLHGKNN